MIFDRLANGIQKYAKVIIVLWVVTLVAMSFFALKSGEVMSYDMNDMAPEDSESIKGIALISEEFPSLESDVSSTPILVLYYENTDQLQEATQFLMELNAEAASHEHIGSIISLDPTSETGPGIIMAMISLEGVDNVVSFTPEVRAFVADVVKSTGFTGEEYVTGTPTIGYDMETNALEDIEKIDPFTILMILILVGLFFRSFVSSATPPLTIGIAFVATMGLIFFLGQVLNIFFITNMMILVSMMGAGCDYCIFIIARYREELRKGLDHNEAVHQAIVWAGESITISGASVIIGFGAISICDYSMISTMGICLALGILVALIAALTFIPSMLQLVGDRIFWPTRIDAYKEGGKATRGWYAWCGKVGTAYFSKSAKFSIKHAKAIAIVAVLVSVPAVYTVAETEDSYDMISAMLSGESGKGMDYIGDYADQGMVMPNYSVIEYKEPVAKVTNLNGVYGTLYWMDNWKKDIKPTLDELYGNIKADENIGYATGPFEWQDMLDAIAEKGITDNNEKVNFVKNNLPASNRLYFETLLSIIMGMAGGEDEGETLIFEGVGPMIDSSVEQIGIAGWTGWDNLVAAAIAEGHTDPDDVVETIIQEISAVDPTDGAKINAIVNIMYVKGLSNDILVYKMNPVIDYVMNVIGATIGGEFVDGHTGSGTATYIKITTATEDAAMSPRSMESISKIADELTKYKNANPDIVVDKWDTGTAVVMYEVSEKVKSQFTMIEVLVVVLILILLLVVMRSYLIPLRSVLTILMSISWTLAMTHLIFVEMMGEEVIWLVPILLLVICLGLGMDYDILLTTRIKENVMARGMSNDDAIYHAVTHTGSVITICGLIMGGAFGTLMISGMPLLKEFGFALCFAILVDALVVRTYIVPAIMHLLGDWNWKGPGTKKISSEKEEE